MFVMFIWKQEQRLRSEAVFSEAFPAGAGYEVALGGGATEGEEDASDEREAGLWWEAVSLLLRVH